MATTKGYKYEVAFSFLKNDEAIAYDINDRIQDRLSTFIYSKQQEELGGTDGEKKFNAVFYEEARIVVVLYRDGWGHSPWTRIEETAIKNRAFDKGWGFLLLINLDINSALPNWIPKTYIWLDYERFKSEGAIAVIEQKVKEAGGQPRPETIEDRAQRLKRLRIAEKEREEFLSSNQAINVALSEVQVIINKLKEIKSQIEDPSTQLYLGEGQRRSEMYEIGYEKLYLCFNWCKTQIYKVTDGMLKVSLYEKSGHYHIDYEENLIEQQDYRFDKNLVGVNGWSEYETGENFIMTDELIDEWAKKFIDEIEVRKNHS